MTRLLYSAGDPELAKRTLRLYIQLVSKAREASLADSEAGPGETNQYTADTDRHWVETLVFGTRMLCRLALQESDFRTALELAKEAGTIIEKAKSRLDTDDVELVARVKLAEGIWSSVMANVGTRTFVLHLTK